MNAIRKLPATALATLFACLSLAGASGAGAPAQAPEFRLASRSGGEISLSQLRGQVVMINFWASWCGPCRQEFPVLDAMYRKYRPMGFTLLAINVESDPADAERFLAATPVTFPVAFDAGNAVSSSYGVSAMPTTLIIDRKGQVRWLHRAYKPGDENEYLDRVRALLKEAP